MKGTTIWSDRKTQVKIKALAKYFRRSMADQVRYMADREWYHLTPQERQIAMDTIADEEASRKPLPHPETTITP